MDSQSAVKGAELQRIVRLQHFLAWACFTERQDHGADSAEGDASQIKVSPKAALPKDLGRQR